MARTVARAAQSGKTVLRRLVWAVLAVAAIALTAQPVSEHLSPKRPERPSPTSERSGPPASAPRPGPHDPVADATTGGPVAQAAAALEAGRRDRAATLADAVPDPAVADALRWHAWASAEASPRFADLAALIERRPAWPGQAGLRRNAEAAMPETLPPEQVRAWFADRPPVTPSGVLRQLDALAAAGATAEVRRRAREVWHWRAMPAGVQARFLATYSQHLRQDDHRRRADTMAWAGRSAQLARVMPLLGDATRRLMTARDKLRQRSDDVEAAVAAVPAHLRDDPGLIYERARWRRISELDAGARAMLARMPAEPPRPELWWRERQILARRAMADGAGDRAYRLLTPEGLAFTAEGGWEARILAGIVAYRSQGQPWEALTHFVAAAEAADAPASRARAQYWAGRAAAASGQERLAGDWLRAAARAGWTFYGQRARDARGLAPEPFPAPATLPDREAAEADTAPAVDALIRAAMALHRHGGTGLAEPFVRAAVSAADGPAAQRRVLARLGDAIPMAAALAGDALARAGRPHPAGYPQVSALAGLPADIPDRALVNAITYAESRFDPAGVSGAGARGLMQVMPATARDLAAREAVAGAAGAAIPAVLTNRPSQNVAFGAGYLDQLLTRYDGDRVRALAAYNAGPGRVAEFVRAYGEPPAARTGRLDWIETIPYRETRHYVQQVLGLAHVYRHGLGVGTEVAQGEPGVP